VTVSGADAGECDDDDIEARAEAPAGTVVRRRATPVRASAVATRGFFTRDPW